MAGQSLEVPSPDEVFLAGEIVAEIYRLLNARGLSYVDQSQWSEAHNCFQSIFAYHLSAMLKAATLANVMKAFEGEGRIDEAVKAGREAIQALQTGTLSREQRDAASDLVQDLNWRIARLEGAPALLCSTFLRNFLGSALAVLAGAVLVNAVAWVSALLGSVLFMFYVMWPVKIANSAIKFFDYNKMPEPARRLGRKHLGICLGYLMACIVATFSVMRVLHEMPLAQGSGSDPHWIWRFGDSYHTGSFWERIMRFFLPFWPPWIMFLDLFT